MKRYILLSIILAGFIGIAQAQDAQDAKFAMFGVGATGSSVQSIIGFAAFGYPITDKIMSYTSVDFSVVENATIDKILQDEGLQSNIRTGMAYRVFALNSRISLWGLGAAGAAIGGPQAMDGGTSVTGSFAGGGFVQYKIDDRFEAMLVLEAAKNPSTKTQFIPRASIKVKF